jgi:ATP-dependent Lon protease
MTTNSTLPVFALPYPLVLLPASRLTISVTKDTELAFLNLIERAETKTLPIVAVVPITSNTETTLSEWGTASRVVRVIQKPVRSRHASLVVLHGLTRVRVLDDKKNLAQSGSLNLLDTPIEYAPTEKVPSHEAVNEFKQSALRMLDRLGKDNSVLQTSKHEGYAKIAEMVEDITPARVLWLVDILVANINVDYNDKLGEFYAPLYSLIITFVF